jgi:hypothetical protein
MTHELDSAWDVLSLSFNDEIAEDEYAIDFLERKYDIDAERLMLYCEKIIGEYPLDVQSMAALFLVGFEFGMVYEKYMTDLRRLG